MKTSEQAKKAARETLEALHEEKEYKMRMHALEATQAALEEAQAALEEAQATIKGVNND